MMGLGQRAIGISIEESAIRFVSLKKNKTWEVRKKKVLPLQPGMIVENQIADGESLLDILKPWVKKQGLRGSKVALAIPPAQIIIRKMSIPSTNEKQLDQLVKLEVETGLHLPFENPVYDYVTTGIDENQSHLLVFAAPRKPIQDHIDILEAAGLRVGAVEISATALARSIMLNQGEVLNETMLIHLEQSLLDIYMFREGNPVFIRSINVADLQTGRAEAAVPVQEELKFRSEVAAALESEEEHLSPEQMLEITAEISRMLNFYQYSLHDGSTRISKVLITGTPVLRSQLHDELSQSLNEQEVVPVSLDQLEASAGRVQNHQLNSFRVATGAALGSREPHINLLPREDREAMIFPYLAIALIGIWLLGMAGVGILYAGNKGQISDQAEQLQGLRDRSTLLQLELAKANNGGSGKLDRKAAIDEIMNYRALNIVSVLNKLASGLPQGSSLGNVGYTYLSSIDLTVKLQRMEDAAEYLAELRKMPFTVEASIQKLTEGNPGGNTQAQATLTKYYTAVYRVNLANAVTANGSGEADTNGTNE
ncbi:pilus assembly protein PilM [Paenibacillus sp. MMS20-IR301]|uniref:type IV pilus biogenesis protein PilM n=1 Tax=Paenibacillus sp. MMS20-IR301 TaxID=2895946 RepID=UPI0028E8C0B7|nr:pilus assembly protein PilM [Paenibacillus sp. MMS20-IR301]WNS42695.1 pilus assembly protein PilM [Paenibacillus sp. MMS20-IR301]